MGMSAHASSLPDLIRRVGAELDWFDGVLADRGGALTGIGFGRADLSAAALLAPVALPPTAPLDVLYAGLDWPPALGEALRRWEERDAIRWVRRTYAAHRAPA